MWKSVGINHLFRKDQTELDISQTNVYCMDVAAYSVRSHAVLTQQRKVICATIYKILLSIVQGEERLCEPSVICAVSDLVIISSETC